MAQVRSIINRSFRLLGLNGSSDALPESDFQSGLEALNGMIDSWRNDKLTVYAYQYVQVALINGIDSYTIGPSGGTIATAPVTIESAFIRLNNVDYPLNKITDEQYQANSDKTTSADIPEDILFTHTSPNSTVTLYPKPISGTLFLRVWTPLATVAMTDSFTLPPGYDDAITYNLAIRLSPEYPDAIMSQSLVEVARSSLAAIKRVNNRPMIQITQLAGMFGKSRGYNIISGA